MEMKKTISSSGRSFPLAIRTGKPIGLTDWQRNLPERQEARYYRCLYCEDRLIFKKPSDYVMHLLQKCFVVKNNEEAASLHKIISYVTRLLVKERKSFVNVDAIGGKTQELCLLYNTAIMLPICKTFKCVCCSRKDQMVKIAIEHFFHAHFSTRSDTDDGICTLIKLVRLLNKVNHLDEELIACLSSKELLLHGTGNKFDAKDKKQEPLYVDETNRGPKTEYYTCLICNFKATTISDILNKHAWHCSGQFPKEQRIISCWYFLCDFCNNKKILVGDLEKHLIDDLDKHQAVRGSRRKQKDNLLKDGSVKLLITLPL